MSEKWKMSLEWFDKCTRQDFKNGATISAIRDAIKENERLRKIEAAAKMACEWNWNYMRLDCMDSEHIRRDMQFLQKALAGEGGG